MTVDYNKEVGIFSLAIGYVAYGLVNRLATFERKYLRGEPRLGEPFSADAVRGMYRSLESLRIPNPANVNRLRDARKSERYRF